MLVELERVLSLMDVELDELAGRVLLEDDSSAVPPAAPEKRDVGAGRVAAGELLRVRVEGKALAMNLDLPCGGGVGEPLGSPMRSSVPFAAVIRPGAQEPERDLATVSVISAKSWLRRAPGPIRPRNPSWCSNTHSAETAW